MAKYRLILFIAAYFSIYIQIPILAQESDEPQEVLKNTVRFNLTNPLILGDRYVVFGYERIIKQQQSATVNLGRFSMPKFINYSSDVLTLQDKDDEYGIHISFDYRFYFSKLNRFDAPRGIYVGPYLSYNHLGRENQWILNSEYFDGEVTSDLKFNILTIGAELGYQFVFWDRLAVDFIMFGPGVGFYSGKIKIGSNLMPEDEMLFFEAINDILEEKIPGYDLTLGSDEFTKKGSFRVSTLGFRYLINIGFRF